jgi:hypothetical protein
MRIRPITIITRAILRGMGKDEMPDQLPNLPLEEDTPLEAEAEDPEEEAPEEDPCAGGCTRDRGCAT